MLIDRLRSDDELVGGDLTADEVESLLVDRDRYAAVVERIRRHNPELVLCTAAAEDIERVAPEGTVTQFNANGYGTVVAILPDGSYVAVMHDAGTWTWEYTPIDDDADVTESTGVYPTGVAAYQAAVTGRGQ